MSAGLLSQLDTYYSWIDEAQNPIHPDEVAALIDSPVRELPIPVPANPRRGWLVAVAAAATVLVLVGGAALLLQTRGSSAPVATTPPADPTPTTIAEPADPKSTTLVDVVATGSTWSRVPNGPAGFGTGRMNGVTVGGPGLVAVGSTVAGDGHGDAAVWTSVDGVTWTQVPLDEEMFGDEGPMSVISAGPGLVAVGEGVWTSVDGIVWSRVPDDDGIFDDVLMTSVIVGGPGLVAVGVVAGGEFDNAAVWTSVDGIVWSRVPHDEATFGARSPGVDLGISHVTVGGPGLVAVGMDWSGSDADAAVWTSVDGLGWTRVPHDEEVFGGSGHQAIVGVTAAGPGLVAVGTERSSRQQSVVWTSVDGLTWTRVARDESGSLDRGQMNSVVVGDSGLVAVGWIGWIGGPNSEAAVWTSLDGIIWSRVPHDEEAIGSGVMWDLINTDRGLIAVGSDGTDAGVWVKATEN